MNWSGAALKLTIGVGTLAVVAISGDLIVPYIGLYGMIIFVVVPLALLVFIKPGELPDVYVKLAHIIAAIWYVGMVGVSFYHIYSRGMASGDTLMMVMMGLGMLPLFVIGRDLVRGSYDGAHDTLDGSEEWFDGDY